MFSLQPPRYIPTLPVADKFLLQQQTLGLSHRCAFADEDERRPECWVRLVILPTVDHRQH